MKILGTTAVPNSTEEIGYDPRRGTGFCSCASVDLTSAKSLMLNLCMHLGTVHDLKPRRRLSTVKTLLTAQRIPKAIVVAAEQSGAEGQLLHDHSPRLQLQQTISVSLSASII